MAVQLLPFQKIVDIPDVAQKHRCKIRGLAISSIVLVTISFVLFVFTMLTNRPEFVIGLNLSLGVPSMVVLFFLVCIGSAISLRNTEKWESTDVCCNLMRSRPACCTRSCSSNKKCCARLSCFYIATAVFSGILCAFVIFVQFTLGCTMTYVDYSKKYANRNANRYRGYGDYWRSTTTVDPHTNAAEDGMCGFTAAFGVPSLILLICLVGTTAASAYFLRQVENATPAAEVLPPGKMVTLVASEEPAVHARLVTGNDQQENTKAGAVSV